MGDGHGRSKDGFGIDRDSSARLIVQTALKNGVVNPAQIAYMLATAQHESENFTAPDEHYGRDQARKLNYRGGEEYFGRGYAHLTHVDNYEKFDRLLALDGKLVASPRLAKDPEIAAKVLVIGVRDGIFTGKRLDRYINESSHDFYNARRTVNGVIATMPWSIKAAKQCQEYAEAWEKKVPALIEDVRKSGVVLERSAISDSMFQQSERSALVRKLQENLNALDIPGAQGRALVVDGVYGPSTKYAIASFQRQHGLHVDGLVSIEMLTATQIAVSASNPLHDLERFGERLRQSIQSPGHAVTPNAGIIDGLPDYLPVKQHALSRASPTTAAPRDPQPAPSALANGALLRNEDASIIRTLQQNLNTLGVTDSRGRALQVDGDYGDNTRAAVSKFQETQGLPVTDVADNATLGAVHARVTVNDLQRQKAAREAAQIQEAPLTADPVTLTRETAALHASLHPEQSQLEAPRTTYAATSLAAATEISEARSPRRAPDMPDHHAGLGARYSSASIFMGSVGQYRPASSGSASDSIVPPVQHPASDQEAHVAAMTVRPEHTKSPLDLLLERAHRAVLDGDDYALGSVVRDFRQSSHGREWEQQQHDYSQAQRLTQEAALAQQHPMEVAQPQSRGWSR